MRKELVFTQYKNAKSARYKDKRATVYASDDILHIELISIQKEPEFKLAIQKHIRGNAHCMAFNISRFGAAVLAKLLIDELNKPKQDEKDQI